MPVSGSFEFINGTVVGATDFSEFTVGAGLPSGMTAYGIGVDSPSSVSIIEDPDEGNYFSMIGIGINEPWGFGIDAFDGLVGDQWEILARVFADTTTNFRGMCGPTIQMSGLVAGSGGDFNTAMARFYRVNASTYRSDGFEINPSQVNSPYNGLAIQEAYQHQTWFWIRLRKFPSSGDPSKRDWTGKTWFGNLEDEPSSPDGTKTERDNTLSSVGAIGVGGVFVQSGVSQRIAFLSFTGDPTLASTPTKLDTSWVTCEPESETTWEDC